jgi:hypothetical protein
MYWEQTLDVRVAMYGALSGWEQEQTLDVRVAMYGALSGRKLCGKRGLKGKNQFPSEERGRKGGYNSLIISRLVIHQLAA